MPFFRHDKYDDEGPATDQGRNPGMTRREEIALAAENGRTFRRWGAEHAIFGRVNGDPKSPARDTFLRRH